MTALLLLRNLGFVPQRRGLSRAYETNALRGGQRRLSDRAVKGAVLAFIGAQRRPLTEQAGGSGAGFSQEGHFGKEIRVQRTDDLRFGLDLSRSTFLISGLSDVLGQRPHFRFLRGKVIQAFAIWENKGCVTGID